MATGSENDPLRLTRFYYADDVTLGVLELPNRRVIYTCEDGWHGNQRMISCIPDGLYRCTPRRFFRGNYMAWEITHVPDRTQILFHKGNKAGDVTGCIVVGTELWAIQPGVLGVAASGIAFIEMHRQLDVLGDWWVRIAPLSPLRGTEE